MALLVLGLILFLGIHFLPTITPLRQSLVDKLQPKGYKLFFTAVAVLGLVLIIIGKARADYIPVWDPPTWTRHAAMTLVLIGFILLPAAHMPSNIKRFTRHPMLWGVTFWAAGHLLANGDLASLVLFGSFLVFSLVDMISANARGATLRSERVPLSKDLIVVVAGLLVYALFLFLHPYLFGRAII